MRCFVQRQVSGEELNVDLAIARIVAEQCQRITNAPNVKEALTALSYVLQVVSSGGQYQVVIGPAVADYFNAIMSLIHLGAPKTGEGEGKKTNPFSAALKIISGAFSPLIPLLAGSGMMKAVLTVLVQAGLLVESSSTYLILAAASNAAFYFLPVFLGLTISKQLGANTYVGGAIGAALLEPNFTGLMADTHLVTFLGIGVTPIDYASTIFPIFIAAMIYSVLEKGLKKIIKQELQLFLVPMISLMVMIPFTVIVFGPFGTVVANSVSSAVMALFSVNRMIAGAVLGAAYPYLTMLGLHWASLPSPSRIYCFSLQTDPAGLHQRSYFCRRGGRTVSVCLETADR